MKVKIKYSLCINIDMIKYPKLKKYVIMADITDYFWLNILHKQDEYVNVNVKIYFII